MQQEEEDNNVVIAPSLQDAYEIAMGKPNPYRGDRQEVFMREELRQAGFQPHIVSKEEFDQLLES